jgi:6-pyruvoyltetrahydropterin/6-carboxytetrahydropterin synthase
MYQSTKTYGHEVGLSCAFRQWRADSHCQYIHGYALAFKFVFEASELDYRNWVVDFGGLKPLKNLLEKTFDHKLVLAEDDPALEYFIQGHQKGFLDIMTLPNVGCEAFAKEGFMYAVNVIKNLGHADRVRVVSCEVSEHGANSAVYVNES